MSYAKKWAVTINLVYEGNFPSSEDEMIELSTPDFLDGTSQVYYIAMEPMEDEKNKKWETIINNKKAPNFYTKTAAFIFWLQKNYIAPVKKEK
jgi:hypothetical protein